MIIIMCKGIFKANASKMCVCVCVQMKSILNK